MHSRDAYRSLIECCSLLKICLVRGGGSAWSGGVLLGPRGVGGVLRRSPPVDRITDTCKNITLATTSLWPVIKVLKSSRDSQRQILVEITDNLKKKHYRHVFASDLHYRQFNFLSLRSSITGNKYLKLLF